MRRKSIMAISLFSVTTLLWEYYKIWKKSNKFEKAYWGERRGRTRVEREMKRISNIQLNTAEGFFIQPIGHIESCYRHCLGTPRQGLLVPSSRASLILTRNISPESLVGLENFSHIWLTFKFHLNTNTLKESNAFSDRTTFNAKVSLPVLKNNEQHRKIGVFSSRSPHRPNPIGVTLAKIDHVDKKTRTIYLTACDLVNGTPVFDIKPYVPLYDAVPNYQIAPWIEQTIAIRNQVKIPAQCLPMVQSIQHKLTQYKNDAAGFLQGLKETLEADVRSRFQTKKLIENSCSGMNVKILFDETIVTFLWLADHEFEVLEVMLLEKNVEKMEEMKLLSEVDDEEELCCELSE